MCFWCTTVTADCNFVWYGCRTVFIFNPFHTGHCYAVFGYCITQKQKCLLPPLLSYQSLIHILKTFNNTWNTTHTHTQLKNKQTKCEISFRNAVERVNYVQKYTTDAWCQNPHLSSDSV
jgi:hypothetical protein